MRSDSTSNRPPLTLSANIYYGVGSIAFGVHQATLTSALLLFFNQVVGLPAAWVGAAMSVLALQVFLRKDATHPLGLLSPVGYRETALVASIAIFLSIIISCVGTQRFVGALVHTPRIRATWREKLREVVGTLSNRSFLALTVSGVVGAISTGLRQGLDFYISAYFWELTPAQMSYLAAAALFAAFAGVGLAPAISKRFGKKPAMIGVFFASLFASIAPIAMRLLGLLPLNGTAALFTIVLVFQFIAATLGLTGFIIVTSMMADVVEDAAVSTGQRSEGLLFAANVLISKCVTGVGTFFSALILAWVNFPQHATPGQVDPAILRHLGLVFVPIVAVFSAIAIAVLMFYEIDRSTHRRNVERLESAGDSGSDAGHALSGEHAGIRAVT